MECTPIGRVATPFASTDEVPRQGFLGDASGTVALDPRYAAGLRGFGAGDPVVVVWFADRADRSVLVLDRDDGRGVFTTRSPARPNPICLSRCTVLGVDGPELRGVDMLDGSPVLDLKPPLDPGRRAGE